MAQTRVTEAKRRAMRALDFGASLVLLPVVAPLCLVLMALVRAETPGSPLFVQTRIGRGRKPFRMLKLRTMLAATGDLPSHHVGEDRITRVGRLLRRTKLDELPQLLNVLSGAMSLIGPRPCLPSQAELIAERDRRGLFALRPGVTGPAQVIGIDMSDPARLAEVEAAYFARASLGSDLRILLGTVLGRGAGDAALQAARQPRQQPGA